VLWLSALDDAFDLRDDEWLADVVDAPSRTASIAVSGVPKPLISTTGPPCSALKRRSDPV
jgi:hypothetical protein